MWKHSFPLLLNALCVLLLAASFEQASCEFSCPANYTYPPYRAFPHPSPNKFYYCLKANDTALVHTCSSGRIFNAEIGHCEDLGSRPTTDTNRTVATSLIRSSISPVSTTASMHPSTPRFICPTNYTYPPYRAFPHPSPNKFYYCFKASDTALVHTCSSGRIFNAEIGHCEDVGSSPTTGQRNSSSRPGQKCNALTFSDMVNCFQHKTKESTEKLKVNNNTQYGHDILKKTVKDADEIFTTLLRTNKSSSFNGFDIVSSVDAIGHQVIAPAPNANETYGTKLLFRTLVVQVSLFSQGFIFPNTSLKEFQSNISASTFISFSDDFQPTVVNGNQRRVFCVLYFGLHDSVPTRVVDSEKNYSINSHLISCQLSPSPQTSSGNVYITTKHIKSLDREAYSVCAYWDFAAPSVDGLGAWSRRGCHLVTERSNMTHSVCSCNHLTNFAILLGKERYQASKEHKFALSVITYAGSALSLFGSVAAVGSFIFLSGLHSDRNIIHVNLLTSIAISQTVFLAGVEQTASKAQCKFAAIMLHYFYLVSFAWMLCEGLHLYAMIIKVFNLTSRIYHFVALAWGGPAVLVIITASVRFDSYGTSSSCWLSSERHALLAFIIPVAFTVVVNFVIMALVLKEVLKLQSSTGRQHMLRTVKTALKSLAILFPLLGITWVFGLLLFATKQIFFQYLFAIFSSMQGFFIFLLHCVFNSEIRKSFRRKKETWKSLRAIRSMKKRLSCSVTPSSGAVTPGTKEQTISSERAVTFQRSNNSGP